MSNMRYSIYPETNIATVPADIDSVHLVRPIKEKKLLLLINKCKLKEISLSKSCYKRLSGKVRRMIEKKGIVLRQEEKRGRALGIGLSKLKEIIEMHRDDLSYREIEERLSVPKSTAHYLIRYAERDKIKKGNGTIYLD